MTLQALLLNYCASDSVSERALLQEQIIEKCSTYIAAKEKIANKYGQSAVDDSDYRPDRGHWRLDDDYDVQESSVRLIYSDMWAYGGRCEIGYDFSFQEVDGFDPAPYEK